MAIFSLQTLMYILHMLQMGAQNIHSNRLDRIPIKRFGNLQYLLLEVRAVFCGAADAQQNKSRSLNFFEEIENRGGRDLREKGYQQTMERKWVIICTTYICIK